MTIDHTGRQINLHFELEKEHVIRKVEKNSDEVFLLDEVLERSKKIHLERVYAMFFVRDWIRLDRIRVFVEVHEEGGLDPIEKVGYTLTERGYPSDSESSVHCLAPRAGRVPRLGRYESVWNNASSTTPGAYMMLPAASQLPNPFAVQTPEGLSAESMVSLFVDVFADFQLIRNQGHTFLNGPRGSGKSMMFRFLEPDCQQLATGSSLKDLPFFAVHVPIKNTRLNLTEIECLRGSHAEALIAEHYMVLVVLSRCVDALRRANLPEGPDELIELSDFCSTKISALLFAIGYGSPLEDVPECPNLEQLLRWLEDTLHLCMRELSLYLKRIAFPGGDLAYRGSLGNYVDFLCPFIRQLRGLSFLPDGPVYLLLDDADNLSETQTKVLNEWVSTRSTDDVCLKVSTQLRYKTFRTVTGGTISTPHDYDEINISAVYTSQRSRYKGRMYSIIRKRLELYGMDGNPETFFPVRCQTGDRHRCNPRAIPIPGRRGGTGSAGTG